MFRLSALFATLAATLFLAAPTSAAPSTEEVLHELRHVKTLLDRGNHDYDGHRAKAVADIHKAVEALEHHYHHHHHQAKQTPQTSPRPKPVVQNKPQPKPAPAAQKKPAPTAQKKPPTTPPTVTKVHHQHHEKQARSDHQLREARSKLQNLERQLASAGDIRHQKALIDVARAIEQIDVALEVR